MQTHRVSSK